MVFSTSCSPSLWEGRRSFSSSEDIPSIKPKATVRSQNFELHHSLVSDGTLLPCSRNSKVFANAAVGPFQMDCSEVQPPHPPTTLLPSCQKQNVNFRALSSFGFSLLLFLFVELLLTFLTKSLTGKMEPCCCFIFCQLPPGPRPPNTFPAERSS